MTRLSFTCFVTWILLASCTHPKPAPPSIVYQTDFGQKDGAVSAMKGVAKGVDPSLQLYDLTHEIPPYDIWEAAYRLYQTVKYWPAGTIFVSVVDPGVGTKRRSVVAHLKNGQYVVGPDNGMLTLLAAKPGISEIRLIDEQTNRRPGSGESYTFHGRDVYSYVAARLASSVISFKEVGPVMNEKPVLLNYVKPSYSNGVLKGSIPALDPAYGNVWTNIPDSLFKNLLSESHKDFFVRILQNDSVVLQVRMPYVQTFGAVKPGEPLIYLNNLMNVSLALNEDNLVEKFKIGKGPGWIVTLEHE